MNRLLSKMGKRETQESDNYRKLKVFSEGELYTFQASTADVWKPLLFQIPMYKIRLSKMTLADATKQLQDHKLKQK